MPTALPWRRFSTGRWIAGGVLAAAAVLLAMRLTAPGDTPEQALKTATAPSRSDGCGADLACAARQALPAADAACSPAIAQLAAYGARWLTDDRAQRYTRQAWLNEGRGSITYGGEGVEFELGSGAHRRVRYECDFDPSRRVLLDVRTWPL